MIGIIDYGAGNVQSVSNALTAISAPHFVSSKTSELQRADKLILPGVGEARSAMDSLSQNGILEWLGSVRVPFLGICLGMQLLFEHTSERDTPCLGMIKGTVRRFPNSVKVPHMGWNSLMDIGDDPLFEGIPEGEFFYFLHSYSAPLVLETIGTAEYDSRFTAAVRLRNFRGVQFHPEKSGEAGLKLLANFVQVC